MVLNNNIISFVVFGKQNKLCLFSDVVDFSLSLSLSLNSVGWFFLNSLIGWTTRIITNDTICITQINDEITGDSMVEDINNHLTIYFHSQNLLILYRGGWGCSNPPYFGKGGLWLEKPPLFWANSVK